MIIIHVILPDVISVVTDNEIKNRNNTSIFLLVSFSLELEFGIWIFI